MAAGTKSTNPKAPYRNTTELSKGQSTKPQASQSSKTSYHTTAGRFFSTGRKDITQKPNLTSETKKETLVTIATDYLKNKVVLDPLKHKDVSMKEVDTTIAEHLLHGSQTKETKLAMAPRTTTSSTITTIKPAAGAKHMDPMVAAIESDSDSDHETDPPEAAYEGMSALEPLDSDEEDTEDDHSSSEDSLDESEDEGATTPLFRLIKKTRTPAKPGKKWSFAPAPEQYQNVRNAPLRRCCPSIPLSGLLLTLEGISWRPSWTVDHHIPFINGHAAKEMGRTHRIRKSQVSFTNADGTRSHAKGVIRALLLRVGPLQAKMDLFVSQGGKYDVLLGSDFLAPIGAEIKYGQRRVHFKIGRGREALKGSIKVNFRGPGQDSCMIAVESAPSPDRFQGLTTGSSSVGLITENIPSMPLLEEISDLDSEYEEIDASIASSDASDSGDEASDQAGDVATGASDELLGRIRRTIGGLPGACTSGSP